MRWLLLVPMLASCESFVAPLGAERIQSRPEWRDWYADVRECIISTRGMSPRDAFDAIRFYSFPAAPGELFERMKLPDDIYLMQGLLHPDAEPMLRFYVRHAFVHHQLNVNNDAHDWPEFACSSRQ